jgi:SAM-dependent methyltransferase
VSKTRSQLLGTLDSLHAACTASGGRFRADNAYRIEIYRRAISDGMDAALEQLRAEMSELSAGNDVVETVGAQMSDYVAWMQWSLWDLPVLAIAFDPDPDEFRDAVTPCALAYLAIRAFDDVIDHHFTYKGRRDTLYGTVTATYGDAQRARALSTLAGLLLCLDGVRRLVERGPTAGAMLSGVVGSLRRAVVGAMMEHTRVPVLSEDEYVRMVRLKSVDYWRALYTAVDPEHSSPLYAFFGHYYEVAQYLNDIEDYDEDIRRGQPNLLAIGSGGSTCPPIDEPRPWAVTDRVEAMLADRIGELAVEAAELPPLERAIAETKLADLLDEAHGLGLFAAGPSGNGHPEAIGDLDLVTFSELDDVIAQAGAGSIVEVTCGACASDDRRELFQKQGFRFFRCRTCSHVYVSPRVAPHVQQAVTIDDGCAADRYLEAQRIYAERICQLLRRRTPGARLLDIGFGRGYLMQMAQVYGFEVNGLDSSEDRVADMRPLFGERVMRVVVGRDPIPWRSFDVVVVSHVLEHLPDPVATIAEIASIMNPGGWLYIAVPDVGSMDFRIFGKHWNVVNPLVHVQYFSEQSLTTALESGGFEGVERLWHPRLRDELAPRWMRLMRQLGGSDSSELTILAKLPDDPAYFPQDTGED